MSAETLTMGSLFSGSGGFELAGLLTGKIQPVWASEIEPFAVMVTRRRMPWLKHYGSIIGMKGSGVEPADIITGGSPCQDLSMAGKRAGLKGERSSLFLEMIRVIKEMQHGTDGRYPRYVVWENVPGAFSSNKGRDFRKVLEEFTSLFSPGTDIPMPHAGTWSPAGYLLGDDHGSLAWRVLDAQYWGVPQRRRRIFLVCDTLGGRAPEILFESEGVFRNLAESLGAWQGVAGSAQGSTHNTPSLCLNDQGGQFMNVSHDITGALRAHEHARQPLVLDSHPQDGRISLAGDAAQTLPGNMGTGGNNTPMVLCPGTAAPLQARETSAPPSLDNQSLFSTEPQLICTPCDTGQDGSATMVVNRGWQVRRLTPTECARLQGFPDGWAHGLGLAEEDITGEEMSFWREAFSWTGKRKTDAAIRKWLHDPHSDAAEYKLWGNGLALPCATYVMCGIANEFHKEE